MSLEGLITEESSKCREARESLDTGGHQERLAAAGQAALEIIHEIKNSLAIIKGYNQIILNKAQDQSIRDCAAVINNTADEISRIANEYLEFTKLHAHSFSEVSVNKVIKSFMSMIDSYLSNRGIEILYDLASEEKMVMADESKIKQVFLNIVENAVDAMKDVEAPRLIISTWLDDSENNMKVSICDNGEGMSEEQREKVGTLFFTTKENGTGLGMNISCRIIREHGGRMEIESQKGRGSKFIITIPCKAQASTGQDIA